MQPEVQHNATPESPEWTDDDTFFYRIEAWDIRQTWIFVQVKRFVLG
jgi:hypothetical protein